MTVKTLDSLTLEELQDTYLCSKYGKDPIKCLDCEKHESCPAGKRAIEILNEMTEAKKLSRWEKGAMTKSLQAKARAAEILKHEDPVKYLESQGLKRSAALERIRKYKKNYPDLFGLPVTPKSSQDRTKKTYRKCDDMKSDYLEAIKLDKPANFYVEKYGINYDAAWHRWKDAEKKFKKEEEVTMNIEEAEVSLEDFLKEVATDNEVEAEHGQETPDIPKDNQDLIQSINAKYEEFLLKREKIKEELCSLEAKIEWYDIALRSFETTMNILEKNFN